MRIVLTAQKKDGRSGTALVLAALMCLVLVPILGLAIDGTNVYMMRNQTQNALNAAVIAGIRSFSTGSSVATQEANAVSVAQNTFAANVSGMSPAPVGAFTSNQDPVTKIISVTGSATADIPLMLMGMLSYSSTHIGLSAISQRRSVNIMMVLDNSGPMQGTPLTDMQADATAFVKLFVQGTDNIGLVTFSGAPYTPDPLPASPGVTSLPQVISDINSMTAPGGMTNTAAAMFSAYQQLVNYGQPGALNVIVLFTQAVPGAFTGNFAGDVTRSTPCSIAVSPLNGMLWSNQEETQIGGLSDPVSNSINDTPEVRGAPGCTAYSISPQRFLRLMPGMDIYGNYTNGGGGYAAYTSVNTVYAPVSLTAINATNITGAAMNALDYQANQIRSDTNLSPVIFVIGLANNPGSISPDPVLMQRVANDPASPYYQSAQPAGQFVSAPSPAQLQSAFASIGAQVLQLAK